MALNTPYKRMNPNSINYAAMGQKDPWFALGYALGEGYWNNYNARGEAKATETARQMLAEKTGDSAGVLSNDDLINKYARPDKKQQAIDAAIQLPELKPLSKGKDGESKGEGTTGQPTFDHALLKWGYTQDKYKDSPNPVGDSVAAQKLLNNTEVALSGANIEALDWGQFETALNQKLMLDGRNAQQRAAAIAAIKPMFDGKKKEYDNKVVDRLAGMWQEANEAGDHSSASKFASRIGQINPALGKHLLDSIVTPKDKWKAEVATNAAIAKAAAKAGGKSVKDSDRITAAKAVYDHYQKWQTANPDKSIEEYPRHNELNAAQNTLGLYAGYAPTLKVSDGNNEFASITNKYKGMGAYEAKEALAKDTEVQKFLKENPSFIPEFESQTGITLPRK